MRRRRRGVADTRVLNLLHQSDGGENVAEIVKRLADVGVRRVVADDAIGAIELVPEDAHIGIPSARFRIVRSPCGVRVGGLVMRNVGHPFRVDGQAFPQRVLLLGPGGVEQEAAP